MLLRSVKMEVIVYNYRVHDHISDLGFKNKDKINHS